MSTSDGTAVDDIGEFYDEMSGLIEIMGGNIHVGYWTDDQDHTPLLEAINRLTDLIGSKLRLQEGDRLLDVGCGVGVPAIRLGQRTDAQIVGVTISRWQAQEGVRRVNGAGLRGQVRIEHGDAAALDFPDAGFDAVLALESIAHATDRSSWLREMFRVLRPGGRLVLTDFTEEKPLSEEEAAILRAGALQPPLPLAGIAEEARGYGFEVDEIVDCGDRIRRSYDAYLERIARHRESLIEAFGEERVQAQADAMKTLLAVYRAKLGYAVVVARRPG